MGRLGEIRAASGPESVAFSRPAPGGSAASDWMPWLIRLANAFGSPNVITTSYICQWGRDQGSAYTYGRGLPAPHFEAADTILLWGHNPAVSRVTSWRRIRKAQRRGARLLVVDPRRTETARQADIWVAPRHGTDAALLLGLLAVMVDGGLYDEEFVRRWTNAPFLVDAGTKRFLRAADFGVAGDDKVFAVVGEDGELVFVDAAGEAPMRAGRTPRRGRRRTRDACGSRRDRGSPTGPARRSRRPRR